MVIINSKLDISHFIIMLGCEEHETINFSNVCYKTEKQKSFQNWRFSKFSK